MNSFELKQSIDAFFDAIDQSSIFVSVVSALAMRADDMDTQLTGIAEGGPKVNDVAGQIHSHLSRTGRTTSSFNHRQFFRSLEHFKESLELLQSQDSKSEKVISELGELVEEFAGLYDAFLSNPGAKEALPLLLAARRIDRMLITLIGSLRLLSKVSEAKATLDEAEAFLSIWLHGHMEFGEFVTRLAAIQSLYSQLCTLFSVSESEFPLRISKIESGSLWAKLFGESRVVGMMAALLEQTAGWMYRNFTAEGRLSAIPGKVEAIDSLLGLKQKLKDAGIQTDGLNQDIEKAVVAISKDLVVVLEGQRIVTVNDRDLASSADIAQRKLAHATVPLLSSSSSGHDAIKQ
jgi:hypothetical protein